ncbi:three-helix bundle dimerization domain-containing protein [Streptomyces sp. NPDC093111]|uniref:three-helix bundle dimerization domain-containing protein n=1 Tax=Streptomyces sp. NPDC093111 TaxID=3154978 RepID=UPI003418EBCD
MSVEERSPHVGPEGAVDESPPLAELVVRLVAAYPSADVDAVEAVVRDACAHFEHARIRAYLPILIERRSRKALDAVLGGGPGHGAEAGP